MKNYVPKGQKALILRYFARQPYITPIELAAAVGISRKQLDVHLTALRKRGLLKKHVFHEVNYLGLKWDNGAKVRRTIPPGVKPGSLGWWRLTVDNEFPMGQIQPSLDSSDDISGTLNWIDLKLRELQAFHQVGTFPKTELIIHSDHSRTIAVVELEAS